MFIVAFFAITTTSYPAANCKAIALQLQLYCFEWKVPGQRPPGQRQPRWTDKMTNKKTKDNHPSLEEQVSGLRRLMSQTVFPAPQR
jgi:hypothetical protein